jgi:hypothetical protein
MLSLKSAVQFVHTFIKHLCTFLANFQGLWDCGEGAKRLRIADCRLKQAENTGFLKSQ